MMPPYYRGSVMGGKLKWKEQMMLVKYLLSASFTKIYVHMNTLLGLHESEVH